MLFKNNGVGTVLVRSAEFLQSLQFSVGLIQRRYFTLTGMEEV